MILGIIRGATKNNILPVIDAAFIGGLQMVEITLNTPDALEMISMAGKQYEVGAGTVMNVSEAKAAIEAGARFIVSPIIDPETIAFCKENGIVVFPGASTPNEVYRAWQLGATMVKIFPVKSLGGPEYIRELKGPFDQIKLLATGGVNAQNIKEYFTAGASAVAIGGSVFDRKVMEAGEYDSIKQKISEIVNANKL